MMIKKGKTSKNRKLLRHAGSKETSSLKSIPELVEREKQNEDKLKDLQNYWKKQTKWKRGPTEMKVRAKALNYLSYLGMKLRGEVEEVEKSPDLLN